MSSERSTPRELGEEGLRQASERLRERQSGQGSGSPLVSLGEVLTWLFALKEFHGLVPPGSSIDEETLHGLIYARHQFAHRLEELAEIVMWQTSPVGMGHGRSSIYSYSSELRWKPRVDLGATRPHLELEPLYDQHVAGKPLLEPIEMATQFILEL